MTRTEHPGVRKVTEALAAAGATGEVVELADVVLGGHDVVWAAAGIPHTVFPTTYQELVRITGGTPAEVG